MLIWKVSFNLGSEITEKWIFFNWSLGGRMPLFNLQCANCELVSVESDSIGLSAPFCPGA